MEGERVVEMRFFLPPLFVDEFGILVGGHFSSCNRGASELLTYSSTLRNGFVVE